MRKEVQKLQWTDEQVSDFWDYMSNSEFHKENYFTKYYSSSLINFLQYLIRFEGEVLDYGCGLGFIVEELLKKNISCQACDFSEASVIFVNNKFSNNILWKGAKLITDSTLPYADNSIDLIICVETIEHILDKYLSNTLQELYRILKPNTGRLFITTPNNEDLSKNIIFCPKCYSVFHNYQHIRSFDIDSLNELMNSHNFRTEMCYATYFSFFEPRKTIPFLDWSLRKLDVIAGLFMINILEKLNLYQHPLSKYLFKKRLNNTRPHLFWIGGK